MIKKMKGGKMEKSVKITLIIAVTALILALIYYNSIPSTANTVSVNGESSLTVVPDLVAVYLNVDTVNKTAEVAKDANAEIVDKIKTALIKQGFESKEIETISYNLYPEYDWDNGKQDLIGYKATHQLRIKMSTDKSDKIGNVIDAGVDSGATIGYINFELSPEKENEYKAEAMKLATQDANTKAEAIASGLNKKVGKLVSISANSFDYYPWRLYEASAGSSTGSNAADAKAATTSITPGNQDVSASVTAVFKLN